MSSRLEEIVARTRVSFAERQQRADGDALERRAANHIPRGFAEALRRRSGTAVIAELKRASPSKGVMRAELNVAELARELEAAHAATLSVLTEEQWFLGSLGNLELASRSCSLPCLRKDFMVDPRQMLEARAHCADAVLLIAAALSDGEMRGLAAAAREQGLDILAEVHDANELDRVLDVDCDAIGVNSRNLHTFHTSLDATEKLGAKLAASGGGKIRVAESAIQSGEDMRRLRDAGFEAFLIGETLMRAAGPGEKLKEMLASCG